MIKHTLSRVVLLCLFFLCQASFSQQRPKVGLVLSGGGAKGLAHVPLLQAIDSLGIKIDYITGTSMGSIVGGLYAMGYSGDSIRTIFSEINWDVALTDRVPYSRKAYEEKNQYETFVFHVPLVKGKPKFSGVIEGRNLATLFSVYTLPLNGVTDFDKLPIPYRAISTDVVSGDIVVLDSGSLGTAMRASMAIPTAFTPVRMDSMILVDGGVVRNFPVTEVKDMGAQFVIGSSVSDGMKSDEDLTNPVNLLFRIGMLEDLKGYEKQKEQCDIFLRPETGEYTTGSFDEAIEIMALADSSIPAILPQLIKLKESQEKYEHIEPMKHFVGFDREFFVVDTVIVKGLNRLPKEFVLGKLHLDKQVDTIYKEDFVNGIDRLYGTNYFEKIQFEVIKDETNKRLVMRVVESPQTWFNFGFQFDSYYNAAIVGSVVTRDLLLKMSRSSLTYNISEHPFVELEFMKYYGKYKNFTSGLRLKYFNDEYPYYEDGQLSYQFSGDRKLAQVYVQRSWRDKYSFGFQVAVEEDVYKPKVGTVDSIAKRKENYFRGDVYLRYNRLDRPAYPRKGGELDLMGTVFGLNRVRDRFQSEDIPDIVNEYDPILQGHLNYRAFKPFVKNRLTGLLRVNATLTFNLDDNANMIASNYFIGSPFDKINRPYVVPFIGLEEKQVASDNYTQGELGLRYSFAPKLFLTGRVGVNYTAVNIEQYWIDIEKLDQYIFGYGLSLSYFSVLGPVDFTMMQNTESKDLWFHFNLGYNL